MKKVLLWTLYVLFLAATVLCFVFPVQAKEVSNNIMNVLNTPIVIAGISTTLGGIFTFIVTKFIMSNTKFGRKELDKNKAEVEDIKKQFDNLAAAFNDNLRIANEWCASTKQECDNKVTVMLDQFEDLQAKTINALKTIPNKKVQAIVEEYESEYANKKQEIIEKTINTNEYIDKKIAEMKAEFDKLMEKLKYEEAENDKATEE